MHHSEQHCAPAGQPRGEPWFRRRALLRRARFRSALRAQCRAFAPIAIGALPGRVRLRTALRVWGGAAAWAALGGALACAPQPPAAPVAAPLELRVVLERAHTSVGEPLALMLELALPPGVVPGPPEPEPSEAFETAALGDWQALPAAAGAAGARYALRWTVLARGVGRQRLPALGVPLRWPGGERERVELAALPLEVRSVREGAQRDRLRDIRAAPPPPARTAGGWLAGAAALLLGAAAWWLALRRRSSALVPGARRAQWAADALRALGEALAIAESRRCAAALGAALRDYAERCHGLDARALTARELPECVEEPLRALLAPLERERFRRSPERARIEACALEARLWLEQQREAAGA